MGKTLSQAEKLKNLLGLDIRLYAPMLIQVRSKLIKLHQGNECIINHLLKHLLTALIILKKRKKLYTVECLQKNNLMIWKDSVTPYNLNFLTMSLLKTVVQGLTLKEKDYRPFWTTQCQEISKKLWLPIKTDCVDLGLNLSNSFVPETMQESLYLTKKTVNPLNKNLQKTSYQLSPSLAVNKWEKENTELMKSVKIKLYLSTDQRKKMIDWFNTSKYVYNQALNGVENLQEPVNKISLRNKYVTKSEAIEDWELETPKVIRQQAVFDMCKAYKTCFSQLKSGQINKFKVKFKSKKDKTGSIGIEQQAQVKDKKVKLFPTFLGKQGIRLGKRQAKQVNNLEIKKDSRICYDGYNFSLCVPVPVEVKEPEADPQSIIALDPGTRCFSTGYDPFGNILEFNRKDDLLKKLKTKINLYQSLRKKNIKKVRKKVKNCVSELHWSTINYLVKNYRRILLPDFESQKISIKSKNKTLNRDLNILSHYLFKGRLLYKSKVYSTMVYSVNEAFTSKTCGNCGTSKEDLKANKEFSCLSCGSVMDRDYNAARNILLKHLV